jgi:biotin carboxyl carrier protein
MRRFSVKVGGKERVVELEDGEGGRVRAVVDGVARELEAAQAEPGLWLLREGTAQALAFVDGAAPKLTVELRRAGGDPVVIPVEVGDARSATVAALARRAAAVGTGPATVRSPIPGRVVKLLVRAGDRVTAGQAVVVLEAMKMENELRAPRAGAVETIRCAEGAAVEAGQDLVIIS